MFKFLVPVLILWANYVNAMEWRARPAWPDVTTFSIGSALTVTSLLLNKDSKALQKHEAKHKLLGDWAKVGDYSGQLIPNALYSAYHAIAGHRGSENGFDRASLMVTATLEAALITTVLKYTVRQARPDSNQKNSFPSGHTTTAFAFAAIVGEEHGWVWGIPAYSLATLVGWSRMHDNKHYLHDVLAGATIGTSVGRGVHRKLRGASESQTMVIPVVSPGTVAVFVERSF